MIPFLVTAALAGPLDGKTFAVTLTDPAKKADADKLVFSADTFLSEGCRPYGFGPTRYTAVAAADAHTVTLDASSPAEGTTHWVLTVRGAAIEGTLDWTKAGQAALHYVVSGSLAK